VYSQREVVSIPLFEFWGGIAIKGTEVKHLYLLSKLEGKGLLSPIPIFDMYCKVTSGRNIGQWYLGDMGEMNALISLYDRRSLLQTKEGSREASESEAQG